MLIRYDKEHMNQKLIKSRIYCLNFITHFINQKTKKKSMKKNLI